jgi:hypothetical protein
VKNIFVYLLSAAIRLYLSQLEMPSEVIIAAAFLQLEPLL